MTHDFGEADKGKAAAMHVMTCIAAIAPHLNRGRGKLLPVGYPAQPKTRLETVSLQPLLTKVE
jgi:hypothetical protein